MISDSIVVQHPIISQDSVVSVKGSSVKVLDLHVVTNIPLTPHPSTIHVPLSVFYFVVPCK